MMKSTVIALRMPNWIGDTVLASPVLTAIKRSWPHSRLIVLAKSWTQPLLENDPRIDELLLLPQDVSRNPVHMIKASSELRSRKPDIYVTLPDSFSTAFLGFLARVPRRIGYEGQFRSLLLTDTLPRPPESLHRTLRYFRLLKHTGIDVSPGKAEIFPPKNPSKHLVKIIKKYGLAKGFIGLNPNSQAPSRRWFPERFAHIANALIRKKKKVVIFGTVREKEISHSVNALTGSQCINLTGALSLKEFMSLLKTCELFLTNDTGPMHIALALGTRTLVIEGAGDLRVTGPLRPEKNKYYNIHSDVICRPCVKNRCPLRGKEFMQCMEAVSAESVMAVADRILRKR